MLQSLKANNLKPKFTSDAEGNLFVQISVGGDTMSRPLPAMQTIEEAEPYINKLVMQMAKDLYRKRRNRAKRERKLAR